MSVERRGIEPLSDRNQSASSTCVARDWERERSGVTVSAVHQSTTSVTAYVGALEEPAPLQPVVGSRLDEYLTGI